MGKSYLFISGKGGVGKSTLAAAIGVAAARAGMRVALVDADIGLRSLDLLLGLQDRILYDMADLTQRRCSLDQALIKHPEFPTLSLLVGGQQARPKEFKRLDLQKILNTLHKRFDLVLVDGPAGLGRGMRNFVGLADEVLLVATPDAVSLRSVEKIAQDLYNQGIRPGLLFNRYTPGRVLAGELAQPNQLAATVDLPLLGVVEESPLVLDAQHAGHSAAQTGDEGMDTNFLDIVQRLLGLNNPIEDYLPEKLTRWQRFLKWLED
ncbi:MAG: AAA family ATPase [Clostridiales bacterium]|nr:AAA family ATPase [Clostridiales bacterium]